MIVESLVVALELPPAAEDVTAGYLNTGAAALRVFQSFEVSGEDDVFKIAYDDRVAQQASFLSGKVRNPVLNNCPHFTLDEPVRHQQFSRLRESLLMHQLRVNDIAQPLLEDDMAGQMIEQRLDELIFVESAAMIATQSLDVGDRRDVGEILRKTGRKLYGMPDKAQSLGDIKRLMQKSAEYSVSPDHPLAEVARELHELVALDVDVTVIEQQTLSPEDTDHYYQLLEAECRPALSYAFEDYPDQDSFTVEEMQAVFSKYVSFRGYDAAGMRVVIVLNRTICATKQLPYVVEIGSRRPTAQRSRKRVTQSLIHEVEVHGGRIYRGLKLGTGLAGYGLRRHEIFEEALAGTIEGIVYNKAEAKGEMQAMAIAVAAGYDNGQDRDFNDSFEALWRLQAVKSFKLDGNIDTQINDARTKAYGLLVRIWRGMPTDIAGCIYTKDQAFRNTNTVLPYLRGPTGPLPRADFLRLLQAKYDPTIADQKAYIESLTVN